MAGKKKKVLKKKKKVLKKVPFSNPVKSKALANLNALEEFWEAIKKQSLGDVQLVSQANKALLEIAKSKENLEPEKEKVPAAVKQEDRFVRLECVDTKTNKKKFYEIALNVDTETEVFSVITGHGRIGRNPTIHEKYKGTAWSTALGHYNKLKAEKMKKGYKIKGKEIIGASKESKSHTTTSKKLKSTAKKINNNKKKEVMKSRRFANIEIE